MSESCSGNQRNMSEERKIDSFAVFLWLLHPDGDCRHRDHYFRAGRRIQTLSGTKSVGEMDQKISRDYRIMQKNIIPAGRSDTLACTDMVSGTVSFFKGEDKPK